MKNFNSTPDFAENPTVAERLAAADPLIVMKFRSSNAEAARNEFLKNPTQATEIFDAFMADFDVKKVAWVNPPQIDSEGNLVKIEGYGDKAEAVKIGREEALSIYERKLNGTYTERCTLFLAGLPVIVANGYDVALVQFTEDDSAPFDSKGWIVVVVGSMPIYHLAPWDLDMSRVAHLVNILTDEKNPAVSWKGTDKRGEAMAINAALTRKGEDLVSLAKSHSN